MRLSYLIILCFFIATVGCQANQCDPSIVASHFDEPVEVTGPFSLEQIEVREMTEITVDDQKEILPFGYINSDWEAFKAKVLAGDCLFFFRSDDASWEALHGREGYILFRGQQPIDAISTKRS